jgi:hypothetical protein
VRAAQHRQHDLPRTAPRAGTSAAVERVTDGVQNRPGRLATYASKMSGKLAWTEASVQEPISLVHSGLRRISTVSPGCAAKKVPIVVSTSSKFAF